MKIALYGNGSSKNHGCEAIVRGTVELLNTNDFLVLSEDVKADHLYGLQNLATLIKAQHPVRKNIDFLKAYLALKLHNDFSQLDLLPYFKSVRNCKGTINYAFSIGGDNYCYGYERKYTLLNRLFHKNNIKTVLWGCSIEPEIIKRNPNELKEYDLIVARETITYNALREINANVLLSPDPAFFMKPQVINLPKCFSTGEVIGINISPVIVGCENRSGICYQNYCVLIRHILDTTDASIVLIPHVVFSTNDDREISKILLAEFSDTNRVTMVEDYNAAELKYIISNCSFFIGARTHATIAAYSAFIPTIVVGYSVKANGIATDLFGTTDNYVLSVQSLNNQEELKDAFICLYEKRREIQTHLKHFLPDYLDKATIVCEKLKELEN